MSIWRNIFGGRDGEGDRGGPTGVCFDNPLERADCGFCGKRGLEPDASARSPYPVWRCACGAIGSGAMPWDLDEAADALLQILNIDARAAEAAIPTDHPAIFIQRYDADQVVRNLEAILRRHAYAFVAAPHRKGHLRNCWAKGSGMADERLAERSA